jgi:hypothetical protein
MKGTMLDDACAHSLCQQTKAASAGPACCISIQLHNGDADVILFSHLMQGFCWVECCDAVLEVLYTGPRQSSHWEGG